MSKGKLSAHKDAERLTKLYLDAKARKEQADADLKVAKEGLEAWLTKNPPAEGENSVRLGDGLKVGWTRQTTVKLPLEFDCIAFAKAFPKAVTFDVSVSAVNGLLLADSTGKKVKEFGIELVTKKVFSVTK